MLEMLWDTRGYFFWLLVVSAVCLLLERAAPWRKHQKLWRRQFGQDLFWLVFNGHYAALLVSHVYGIDGQVIEVPDRTTILDAARLLGDELPSVCNDPRIRPVGGCRLYLENIALPIFDALRIANPGSVREGTTILSVPTRFRDQTSVTTEGAC